MTKSMGEVQNLEHKEAIEKIRILVNHNSICLFGTGLTKIPVSVRPMSTQTVDDDGCLWFFSPANSEKNIDITDDPRVQLFYANPDSSEFLSIFGHAIIITDRQKIKDLWSPAVKAWFEGGEDDAELSLIKVSPEEAYYWDTKNNKATTMMKIAAAALTGQDVDPGVKGKLKV